MNRRKEELDSWLWKIIKVYVIANEAFCYTEYFHNPKTKEEREFAFNSAHKSDMNTIRHLLFRSSVTEIAKLFSRSGNDRFRLEKLLNSLGPSGHFRDLGFEPTLTSQWTQKLIEYKPIIDDLLLLRDKIYAHTDNPDIDYNHLDITFDKLKTLLDLAKGILREISVSLFNADLEIDALSFDRDRFSLIRLMAVGEKARLDDIIREFKERTGSYQA